MSMFREQYKKKGVAFGNVSKGRFLRTKTYEEVRKQNRAETFYGNRNISNSTTAIADKGTQSAPPIETRLTRLYKWKAEREKCRKLEQSKKKPAFVVGIPHHKIYSPVTNAVSTAPKVTPVSVPKRITRATEKRLMNKALTKKITAENDVKTTATVSKDQNEQKREQSFAPKDYKFKGPSGLPQELLFGRVAIFSVTPSRLSEQVNNKQNSIQLFNRRSTTNDIKRDSIKATPLNLPFSKRETLSSSNNSSSSNSNKTKANNSSANSSKVRTNSSKVHSNSKIHNNNKVHNNTKEQSNTEEHSNSKEHNDSTEHNSTKEHNDSTEHNNTKEHNSTKVLDTTFTEPSTSLNRNVSILTESNSPSEPAFFSPYIVSCRGKSNARKEQQLKRGFSLGRSPKDEILTKDTVMQNLNISVEEEERTAQYFQFLLNKEIERLNELCQRWTEIKDEPETTEDGQYEINQAIGQTNLLMNKKFARFRGLVADCATGRGEMLVGRKDLQGFWDMMYMEVKNCDKRFEKLEKLRLHGWKEELPVSKPAIRRKVVVKKKVTSAKPSSFRNFLAEKKKKVAVVEGDSNNSNTKKVEFNRGQVPNNRYEKTLNSNTTHKMRRCMSIGSAESKHTPMKHNVRLSLLQKVQLSEASKKMKSPLTMMKISRMCKTPEVQLDNTISYVNSDQTPGKSILKQKKSTVEVDPLVKTTNKVNFDDHIVLNDVPVDEETQTKIDLAAALSRIDTLDFDGPKEVPIHAERKLSFDDNSSDEEKDDIKEDLKVKGSLNKSNKILFTQPEATVPLQELNKNRRTPHQRRSLRRQYAVDSEDETLINTPPLNLDSSTPFKECISDEDINVLNEKLEKHVHLGKEEEAKERDTSIRILRNRIVTSQDTPKPKKRYSRSKSLSIHESEHKENETPSKGRRRKSSLKVSIDKKATVVLSNCLNETFTEESKDKRKSIRSVKFSEQACSGCVINKPALPMTPHVRRSKTQSAEKKRKSDITKSLDSCETPEKPPERVRRSQSLKQLKT